jgi:predicted DNA-binding transcriptional regulator AlpA
MFRSIDPVFYLHPQIEEYMNDLHLLSRRETALKLGISLSTLDRQVRDGRFPFNLHGKIGRRILFSPKVVALFFKDATDEPEGEE